MPIQKRQESSTKFYHVTARGINKEHIFNQIRERYFFLKILKKYLEKYDVRIYAYCIMSNHIHLLIQSELEVLSLFMARVLAEYAEYYNYKHIRNGHVFQNRFGSECIESEKYFWNCIRYIHLNPVKAGASKNISTYRFSSINEYSDRKTDIIHTNAIYMWDKKFPEIRMGMAFHEEDVLQVFIDTYEDKQRQMQELAVIILKNMSKEESVHRTVEILEDKSLRYKYVCKLMAALNISKNRAQKLYKYVKESIMST